MKLLNLVQKSDEWREYRRRSITATDFAVVAANEGLCPNLYNMSLDRLIAQKLEAKEIPDNKYFKLGRDNESQLLARFDGIHVIDGECAAADENPYIMASFDGRDPVLETVIEIKATTKDMFQFDKQFSYYQYQILHQLHVAGYDRGNIIIGYFDRETFEQVGVLTGTVDSTLLDRSIWMDMCNVFLEKLNV